MKDKKNNSFFKELFASIKDFEKYQDFAIQKVSKEIVYTLKLIAIFTFIISLAFTLKIHIEKNKLVKYVDENISNINFEDSRLSVNNDEKVILKDIALENTAILIETKELSEEEIKRYEEDINEYSTGIIFLNDKMIVKTELSNGYTNLLYSDIVKEYNITNFNKQDLLNAMNGKELITFCIMFFGIFYLYMFIIYFITILIYAIMLAILGRITSILLRIPMKYKAIFNMALHALTLPIILNLIYIIVNLFTGFNIKYFQIMYSTISYIYIVAAILMIKTDFIKRQKELSQIIEEQQKIREEYNENMENNKNQEDTLNQDNIDSKKSNNTNKNNENRKENDDINKDINSKENKDGQEPETNNA